LKKAIKQVLNFLVFLAISILLLWLAFRNVKFDDLGAGLRKANYFFVFLSVTIDTLAFLSRARRWVLMINPLGYKPTFWNTFHSMMTGYLANLALPRIGEITRCVVLGKREKIPVDKLIGTVVVERAIDFFALVILLIVMIFKSVDKINQFLNETILIPLREKVFTPFGLTWIIWVALLLFAGLLLFLIIKYRKNLRKIPFFSKIFDLSRGIMAGLKSIASVERKWEFIFHTIFIWICYILMTWVVVFAIDSTSHLDLGDAIFLLVIGGFAMVAPVPNGIGAYHYIISRGLIIVLGVNLEDGALYSILAHESQLILIVIVGTISFFLMFRKYKNTDPQSPFRGAGG
jgi:uncharacterized protein (TIRG00374 family)